MQGLTVLGLSLDLLDNWNEVTLNQVSVHDAMFQSGTNPSCKKCCNVDHQKPQTLAPLSWECNLA